MQKRKPLKINGTSQSASATLPCFFDPRPENGVAGRTQPTTIAANTAKPTAKNAVGVHGQEFVGRRWAAMSAGGLICDAVQTMVWNRRGTANAAASAGMSMDQLSRRLRTYVATSVQLSSEN